jgi:hypothetical protein
MAREAMNTAQIRADSVGVRKNDCDVRAAIE